MQTYLTSGQPSQSTIFRTNTSNNHHDELTMGSMANICGQSELAALLQGIAYLQPAIRSLSPGFFHQRHEFFDFHAGLDVSSALSNFQT